MLARWVILLSLLWIGSVYAQPDTLWTRMYGDASHYRCYGMQQTADSGFIMVGIKSPTGFGDGHCWLLKTNANGDSLWSRTFGGPGNDGCWAVQQTTDGGYMLAGYLEVSAADTTNFWLIKTDANGDSLWSRHYGGQGADECLSALQTVDGGYILAGYTTSFGSGQEDFWLLKTNSTGDSLWSHTFGGPARDVCYKIRQTSDGGFILAGNTDSYGAGGTDYWMIKTDAEGDSLWSRTIGTDGPEECHTVRQTTDGGYILAGTMQSPGIWPWLVKTDANGDTLWTRIVPIQSYAVCHDVLQLPDSGYLLGGYRINSFWNRYLAIQRTDSNGDSLWTRYYRDFGLYTAFWSIQPITSGGYALAGYAGSTPNKFTLWKLAPDPVATDPEFAPSPLQFGFLGNYPNPFNASTRIAFSLPQTGYIDLNVYDVTGRLVRSLAGGHMGPPLQAGEHQIEFDGSGLASGIYFTRLQVGEMSQTRKMVLLK